MLTLLWALPALAALAVAAGGRRVSWLGPAATGVALALCIALWPGAGHLGESVRWFSGPYGGVARYSLGLSGLSWLLVAMTLLLTFLCTLAGLRLGPGFTAWLTLLGGAASGLFLARDLMLFYIFWEGMLIPAYFLLLGYGGAGARAVSWRFLLYNVGGSVALLLGLATLIALRVRMPGLGVAGFGGGAHLPAAVAVPVAVALMIAFAVKTPLWPLHGWVADTYAALPAPAAALVAGVQSKAGLYGMLALLLPLLPEGLAFLRPVLVAVGLISILYGGLCALAARDPRRLLAYSSVSHLGLVAIAFTTARASAISGGVIQMVAHGIFTAALFLLIGMLESRLGGPVTLAELGGLARRAPALAGALVLAAMAALGLPGLAGFPGELWMLLGIFRYSPALAVVGGVALVLAAAYLLRLIQLVLHGPQRPGVGEVADLRAGERWLLAPLAALLVLIGLWPRPVPQRAAPAVAAAVAPTRTARV